MATQLVKIDNTKLKNKIFENTGIKVNIQNNKGGMNKINLTIKDRTANNDIKEKLINYLIANNFKQLLCFDFFNLDAKLSFQGVQIFQLVKCE